MEFISNIEQKEYDKFVINHKKSHVLQSYDWGQFAKIAKNATPHYIGLKDKNNLVAATLLLEKKMPLGYSYFYAPRGFVIDYDNQELLKTFIKEIKNYLKDKKAIFLKIDPDLIIRKENYLNEEQKADFNQNIIINNLRKLGFKHLGFTKNFETSQPRYSFRIDMTQSEEEIYEHFSKTTKQRIQKAESLQVEVEIGTKENIKDFHNLMKLTENRKDFVAHNVNYYETLYDIFNKKDKCNLYIGKVNIEKIINLKETELKPLLNEYNDLKTIENRSKTQNTKLKELERRTTKLQEDIDKFKIALKEYGSEVILNGHFIIEYGDKAWVLYAGNHNILTDTYANYKTYYEHIKYYKKRIKTYDQFGTIGDLRNDNPLMGLHDFKKKFGGDYVEFIGEFDLVLNPLIYLALKIISPIKKKITLSKLKAQNKKTYN